ncbi:TIGR00282 family metallophosphoesterase [Deinococcus peraridilitoris]|uniref:Metallophosphoesterase, MG_246/BB_0505 family n=1 Tax=Deinococcus peraridilitoris (strain DSM 19664 / LMG 22246 / CIP 109416 / KR-200) TaxID=937777 RepID=L0A6U7_DEIPD|nr:TIGR00282 family metallophosphoesterase [Deinococcus peraridilitoris]AFZ68760.1 metallophosphoesterase, MG_246/BB_0505 family [Deinococcus peraridilitoris DSM 19664]
MLRLLFIGDVYGKPGRRVLQNHLPTVRGRFDFIIANGENSAGGFGLNRESAALMFDAGVNCITLGNHTWGNKEIYSLLDDPRIIRPLNYPLGAAGVGWSTFQVNGERLTVMNAMGRTYMEALDDPFLGTNALLERGELGNVFVDFHAEATSEKAAFAYYLDGRVAAVIGTHTHVATADTRILPQGTGFQTDAGMTGPLDSIIGADTEGPIARFVTRLPHRFGVAEGRAQLNAVALTIEHGKTLSIERYRYTEGDDRPQAGQQEALT